MNKPDIEEEGELEFGEKPQARVPPRMKLLFHEDGTTELVSTKKPLLDPSIIALRVNVRDRLLKDIRARKAGNSPFA